MDCEEVQITLVIKGQQNDQAPIYVALDPAITIMEIFSFVLESQNMQANIKQWTCFQVSKNAYITNLNQMIGNFFPNDQLIIDTSPNARLNLTNASKSGQFQQPILEQGQQQQIQIRLRVIDGKLEKCFTQQFSINSTLDEIASVVLLYLSLSSELAAIDLFIENKPYNAKRNVTLKQLQFKDGAQIDAKVRWQQDEKEYLELSQNLKISPRFAKYLIKHCDSRYDRVRAATKMYQGMHKQIDQLSKIFSKYEIDGLIVYKDQDNDSFTRFWRDLGIEDNTTLQLYITYKFGAQKGAQFSLEEFLLGMIRLKCNTIRELAQEMPELRNKIEKENKYRKLYSYYFKVISLGANTIKFNDAITLWDNLLKDTFPQIKQFIAFCTKGKSTEFQSQTRVSFDLWCQVWKFFEVIGNDYTKFDENDAWPLLIYEFVKFQTKQ